MSILKCAECEREFDTDYEGITCPGCGKELCLNCQHDEEGANCPLCGYKLYPDEDQ